MEDDSGNDDKSKILEVIRQQNETIQQQKLTLDEKDILIKSLQKKILELEEGFKNEMKYKERENMDFEPMETDLPNSGTSGNKSKMMKGEKGQMNQPVNSDDNSEEAVVKALRNSLVLTKILRCIRTKDLLHDCRLVNRDWRDLSTNVLLKRKNIQVWFTGTKSKFVLTKRRVEGWYEQVPGKPLDDLTTLFTTSLKFPCANFSFIGNLNLKDAQTFLTEFGSNIKGLKVGESRDIKFMKLFVEQVPNLERLKLRGVETDGELFPKSEKSPPKLSLICLELGYINFSSSSFVKEIVDAAPNLQQCTGNWSVDKIEFLLPRLHILKGLILAPKIEDVDALEKITKMNLQLKCFEMNTYIEEGAHFDSEKYKRFVAKYDRINSKILSSNRITLEEIKFTPYPHLDYFIQWPEFINVQKLTLSGDDENSHSKLPSFKISDKFPKLHTLCITNSWELEDVDQNDCSKFRGLMMLSNVAPSVKVFEVEGYLASLFPLYSQSFPNLQKLVLAEIQDFDSFAPKIWNVTKLKSLKINFCECTTSGIDAGFTGMEETTCMFLRDFGRGKIDISEIEKSRFNPSILDLTELEELVLPQGFQQEPAENEEFNKEEKKTNKPSFVSFSYAFNLMPKLRVFS